MSRTRPHPVWLGAPLGIAVLAAALTRGGYTSASRALFTGLAGVALLAALALHEREARALARAAPIRVLAVLALLALVSAAWSLDPVASLRWGLVIAGYAAVALAAGVLAGQPRGVEVLAALLVLTAVVTAGLGVLGWALHTGPFAEQIYGRWRPGGPFEYPPALALVQVSALPALLYAMTHGRRRVAAPAAAAAALAAGTLVLSASRWQLVLGIAVLVAALLWPHATLRAGRKLSTAAVATVVLSAAGVYLARRFSSPDGEERLADVILVCLVAGAGWAVLRALLPRLTVPPRSARPLAIAAVVVVAGLGALAISGLSGRLSAGDGLSHGRPAQLRVAVQTALDRPLLGAGADTYLEASRPHRARVRSRYAHNLPLELWAELGLAGLALSVALYVAVGRSAWRARGSRAGWLLGPAALAFLATNLIDFPWHLAGVGALWAAAVGGLVGSGRGGFD